MAPRTTSFSSLIDFPLFNTEEHPAFIRVVFTKTFNREKMDKKEANWWEEMFTYRISLMNTIISKNLIFTGPITCFDEST